MSGSNSIAVLRDGVENLVELARDKQSVQDDITEFKKELRGHKLPIEHLLRLVKQAQRSEDEKKADNEAEYLARKLLGLPMPAEGAVEAPDNPSLAKLVQNRVKDILHLEEEKRGVAEQEKEVYKELKDAGFAIPVVKKIVQFRLNPEKYESFTEMSSVLTSYMEALDDA